MKNEIGATPARTDALAQLGISPAGARILRYFLLRPAAEPHTRELQRLLELGGRSLDRELDRLTVLRALERFEDGRLVRYRVNHASRVWKAVRILASETRDPTALLQAALVDIPGLQAAFIFGSTAKGTQREDSDIDVFVLEDSTVDRKKLLRQLGEAALLLEREVNPVRYTARSLAERLGNRHHPGWRFVRDGLSGPKRWVAGDAQFLYPLAAAAGLKLSDLAGDPSW